MLGQRRPQLGVLGRFHDQQPGLKDVLHQHHLGVPRLVQHRLDFELPLIRLHFRLFARTARQSPLPRISTPGPGLHDLSHGPAHLSMVRLQLRFGDIDVHIYYVLKIRYSKNTSLPLLCLAPPSPQPIAHGPAEEGPREGIGRKGLGNFRKRGYYN